MSEPDHAAAEAPSSKSEGTTEPAQSYTSLATSAAGAAAESATNAATGVKDTMFSMFGGGAKKDTGEANAKDDEPDRSGSTKAIKEKEKAKANTDEDHGDNEEVSMPVQIFTDYVTPGLIGADAGQRVG